METNERNTFMGFFVIVIVLDVLFNVWMVSL